MSDVLMLHLLSGEMVIAKTTISGSLYLIEDPVVFMIDANDRRKAGFVPMINFAEKGSKLELEATSVVYKYTPNSDLLSKYKEFTSGIITPQLIRP